MSSMTNPVRAAVSAVLSISLLVPAVGASSATPHAERPRLAATATTTDPVTGFLMREVRPGVMRIVDDGIGDHAAWTEVDAYGGIWVFDWSERRIIRKLGGPSFDVSELVSGEGWPRLSAGSDGRMLVYDAESISIYADGSWIAQPTPPGAIRHAMLACDGSLWASLGSRDGVARLVSGDWAIHTLADLGLPRGHRPDPYALAETPDGAIWVGLGTVGTAPQRGGLLARFKGGAWQLIRPFDRDERLFVDDMAVGPRGALWVTASRRGVRRVGRWDGTWTTSRGGGRLIGVDPDGRAWMTDRDDGTLDSWDGTTWIDHPFPSRPGYRSPDVGFAWVGPEGRVWARVVRGEDRYPIDRDLDPGYYIYDPSLVGDSDPSPRVRTIDEPVLRGVVVEEVAAGMARVTDDGAGHDLEAFEHVAVMRDGSVWASHAGRVIKLGAEGDFGPEDGLPTRLKGIRVASDGTLLAFGSDTVSLFEGGSWRALLPVGVAPLTSVDRSADGTVWVGTDAHAALIGRWVDGAWSWYSGPDLGLGLGWARDRDGVGAIAQTPDGTIWAEVEGRLAAFDGHEWRIVPLAFFAESIVSDMAAGPDGRVWLNVIDVDPDEDGHDLVVIDRYGARAIPGPDGREQRPPGDINSAPILVGPGGVVWLGAAEAAFRPSEELLALGASDHPGDWLPVPIVGGATRGPLALRDDPEDIAISIAPDGSAWLASDSGLHVVDPLTMERPDPWPVLSDDVRPDRFAASDSTAPLDGLKTEEVRPGVRRVLESRRGHDLTGVDEIAIDDEGVLWVLSDGRFIGANWKELETGWEGPGDGVPRGDRGLDIDDIGSVLVQGRGRIAWFVCSLPEEGRRWPTGHACRQGTGWGSPPGRQRDIRAVHRTGGGVVWVAADDAAGHVGRYDGRKWRWYTKKDLGIRGGEVSDLAETPDGAIWAGVHASDGGAPRSGGLLRFDGKRWRAVEPFGEGIRFGAKYLAVGREGELWANLHRRNDRTSWLGRWDGTGWEMFEKPAPANGPEGPGAARRIAVSPDGVVWFEPGDWAFGGEDWTQPFPEAQPFVDDPYAGDLEFAPDGSVVVIDATGMYILGPGVLERGEPVAALRTR